jgi:Ca2+-binding RTX toxin-like protein
MYGEFPVPTRTELRSENAGSNTINGGEGTDTIYGDGDGGEGAPDSIIGGNGNDVIYGDGTAGDAGAADTIYGGADDDLIYGEPDGAEGAIDRLYGDEGQDTLYSGGGNDFVFGGDGDDILLGGDGGEGAADSMDGGTGRDILVGDTGGFDSNGNLFGGGADTLRGGADDDIIISSMILVTAYDILVPIHSEWRSTERNYETRVDNVLGFGFGPRNNGDSFLLPGDNIRDDEFTDRVFGEGGLDLFFADVPTEDLIGDLAGEQVIEL